ncbi:MAG: BatA domain-containing protein [Pseudomonadales bacterium]|nr:BatA domain-containing protein [Pseudomonadales bacterium]
MSLLTPLFLFGLLGVALPLWLHRLQTQTTEREKFSSTMFLEASKHRIHVQRKLKYLLLLALRMLLLILLALLFSRPSLELPPQALISQQDTHHVIVIDTSFSMNQGNSFTQALSRAEDIIDTMEGGDQASIYAASTRLASVAEASSDSGRLKQALAGLSPDNGRLDVGAMISALNGLIVKSDANFVLHFISDFQQTGQPVRFADLIPDSINGRPLTLALERIVTTPSPNWLVDSIITGPDEITVSVRGFNTESADKQVSLLVNGLAQAELNQTVPASGQALYRFRNLTFEPGDNRLEAVLAPGDDLPLDDHRFSVMDNSPPSPVLLLTTNPDSLAVTYLSAALTTGPRPYEVKTTLISDLDPRILQRYPWLVIDDLGSVSPNLAAALSNYVNAGGAIFAALGERSSGLASLPVSGHLLSGSPAFSSITRHNITRIDSTHPVLSQSAGWNNVSISRVLPLSPKSEDSVLIGLNDIPLLLEHPMGQGRILLLNTRLDNTWTDLPVHPVFVGFMAETARYLSNENILLRQQLADSFLQLEQTGAASGQVFDPQGRSLLALEDTTRAQDVQLRQTGFYRVVTPGGEVLVAVNPDQRESDLSPMDAQLLQRWQLGVAGASAGATGESATAAAQAETEPVEIWRALLLLLVMIVLAESFLGNRYLRFKTGTP